MAKEKQLNTETSSSGFDEVSGIPLPCPLETATIRHWITGCERSWSLREVMAKESRHHLRCLPGHNFLTSYSKVLFKQNKGVELSWGQHIPISKSAKATRTHVAGWWRESCAENSLWGLDGSPLRLPDWRIGCTHTHTRQIYMKLSRIWLLRSCVWKIRVNRLKNPVNTLHTKCDTSCYL